MVLFFARYIFMKRVLPYIAPLLTAVETAVEPFAVHNLRNHSYFAALSKFFLHFF